MLAFRKGGGQWENLSFGGLCTTQILGTTKKNMKKHEKHENYLTTTLAQHFLRLKHRSRRAKPHLGLPRLYVYDIIPIIICIHIFQIMYHKYIINTIKQKKHPVFFIPFMAWFHRLDVNPH